MISVENKKLNLKRENVSCALCGGDHTAVLFRTRGTQLTGVWANGVRYELDSAESIVMCKTCGLVYVDPQPVLGPGLAAYSVEQQEAYFEGTRQIRLWAYRNLVHQIPGWLGRDPHTLLDIGCGDGVLVEVARQAGIYSVGTEIDDHIVRLVRERLGQDTVVTVDLAELPQAHYDVIALINVLEHVPNPKEMLKASAHLLKPDGIVLVHTLNFGGLPAKLGGAKWHQIEPLEHLYYFTGRTLRALMRKAGLEPLDRFSLIASKRLRGRLQYYLGKIGIYVDSGLGLVARHALKGEHGAALTG